MTLTSVIVVGAGAAGSAAATALRAEGYDGRLIVLGAEPESPYSRPPLSKAYLAGDAAREKLPLHRQAFYDEHAIDLRTDTVAVRIDRDDAHVVLATGERIRYDRLVLATGAAPRRLPVPGADVDGVHTLRTLADADALRTALSSGTGRAVVVGGGWIGAEVASTARSRGWEVTIVDPSPVPPARVLGPEMGTFFWGLHRAHGVTLRSGSGVASVDGRDRVQAVTTTDGDRIEADLVVVGIGVRPRTQLAQDAGLTVDDGIVVDARLTTSDPHVLAVGDVASAYAPRYGRHLRVEHWETARRHGRAAARTIVGSGDAYDEVPFFYTDQYDVGMEFRGRIEGNEQLVLRGAPSNGAFVAFWLAADRVAAAMNVNVWDVSQDLDRLVGSAPAVDARRLSDLDTPLGDALAEDHVTA